MNLDSLSLPELLEIQKQLPTLIAQRQEEIREEVVQKATNLATKYGLTLEDLVSKGRKRHAPKYVNPSTGETWAGVGSRPRWVRDWIAAGHSLTDLMINKETK